MSDGDRPGGPPGEEEPKPAGERPGEGEPPAPGEGGGEDAAAEAKAAEEAKAKAKAAEEAKAKAAAAAKAKAEAEAAKPPWERDPETPEWEEADDDPLAAALREVHGDAVESARRFAGELILGIRRDAIRDVAESLKEDHGYTLPVDVCGADYPDRERRFEVVYHLFNLEENRRVRLKVVAGEGEEVPSVTPVWRGANWPEREVYDMFGVRFSDHPDMTRILLWEGFEGHPLRKDFPVEGIDTGSAIYPEYYEDDAGPVIGTGTGWKPQGPPEDEG